LHRNPLQAHNSAQACFSLGDLNMIEDLPKGKAWCQFGSKISEEQLSEIFKREQLIAYFATIDLDVSAFTTGQIEHLASLESIGEYRWSFAAKSEQCQSRPNNGDMRLQCDANSYDCSAQIQSADQK
jgi:hypothetical protein